jgi:ADP-ribose pyrophosphatase YjhB (NUDIX family)
MNQAAVMLVLNEEGKILSVARRNNPTKFGLPGGKKNEWETDYLAAVRETMEETSIKVTGCTEIYVRVEPKDSPDGEDFNTHCFYALTWKGTPTSSEEGEVKWLTSAELTSSEHGAFPDYNAKTLEVFKSKYPNVKIL